MCVTIKIAHWLFTFALGSAALGMMAIGASADELTALKAQIEDLQLRAHAAEAGSMTLPSNLESLSIDDGQGIHSAVPERMSDRIKPDSGTTVSAFPSGVAAPAAEISVSGETRVLLSTKSH